MVKEKLETKVKKEKAKEKKQEAKTSAKGFYHYIKEAWKKTSPEKLREYMIKWRSEDRLKKIDRPTRLDRARALGYKAKKGFVIIRVRVKRGGRARTRINKKRRTKRQSVKKILKMSYQWVAEQRAQRKFTNLEVLNSYPIGKDGKFAFFEVIMVDPQRPEIKSDKNINWIIKDKNRKRAFRGITSAGKKSRGLRHRDPNLKIRPSARSWNRKGR